MPTIPLPSGSTVNANLSRDQVAKDILLVMLSDKFHMETAFKLSVNHGILMNKAIVGMAFELADEFIKQLKRA